MIFKLGATMNEKDYIVDGKSLMDVRNQSELRVITAMNEVFSDYQKFDRCLICYQDVYALSLSKLTPRYVQMGTVVFNEMGEDSDTIEKIVRESFETVIKQPKHP